MVETLLFSHLQDIEHDAADGGISVKVEVV